MREQIIRKTHKIDAEGKSIGRLASTVAAVLIGKNNVHYAPNKDVGDFVEVSNIGKVKFTGKKIEKSVYKKHTGYLGGLKITPVKKVFAENSNEVLRHAVSNMLPKNTFRASRLRRLTFKK